MAEFRALRDLMLLYDEGATEPLDSDISIDSIESTQGTNSILLQANPKKNIHNLKLKSRSFPDLMMCPPVWAFFYESIQSLKKEQWSVVPSNLTQKQSRAVIKLQKNPDLIIKQSDKGGNLVLMTHQQYQTMCLKVLLNATWYSPISFFSIQTIIDELRKLVVEAFWEGLIDEDILKFINTQMPQTPTFYAFTKNS